ncbi:MAG: right-handed parallel beta-helix repeat-containing protein, partial [Deltaproteobacteria bacterium]|nr:right-handed parallel beta-helix repeat-containing protein [Deltaproteobacteria bacterium]
VGADSTVVDTLENIQNLYGNDIYSNGSGAGVVLGNHETPGAISGNYVVRGNRIYSQRAGVSLRAYVGGNVLIRQNEINANWHGGVDIQNTCDNLEIIENNIHNNSRGGIRTGDDQGTFNGVPEWTNLTIRQNKIHHNGAGSYGGGINVIHATANIDNNLVYKNHFGGIRFGDYTTEVKSNTVINNGDVANEKGGGIIFDDLAGAINDPPSGFPTVPFPIQNNISAYNVRAGIRACFYATELYRDYNIVYSNNQDFLSNWCGTCASPDCTTGGRRAPRTCIGAQLGRGCHTETPFCCTAIGASGALPGETLIFADPLFEDMGNDDYHLAVGSPAIGAGEGGTDIGAYGGDYPIDDAEIPGP